MKDKLELSYQGLKKMGLSVFEKTALQCLDLIGNYEVQSSKANLLIVLTSSTVREHAYILATVETAINNAFIIQNLENDLNVKHHFVKITRHLVDRQTVESFAQDAKELNVKKLIRLMMKKTLKQQLYQSLKRLWLML